MNERIPAYLLTGFLGSGKTTLLNAALRAPALAHTAVVVNELGDVGLDQLVVAQASDNVVLLDAGCLCCANTGALHETLADLLGRRARGEVPPFERVVIETSGAADPVPLLHVLLGHPLVNTHYRLAAVVCTIDAQHFVAARAQHPELDKQAAMADRIVVTKRDLADPAPAIAVVEAINPHAGRVEDPVGAFGGDAIPRERTRGIETLGRIRPHGMPGGIRAHAFRPAPPLELGRLGGVDAPRRGEVRGAPAAGEGVDAHGRHGRGGARAGRAGHVPPAATLPRLAGRRPRQPAGVHREGRERSGARSQS